MSVENFLAAVLPSQGHRFVLVAFGTQGSADFRPSQKSFAPGDEKNALGFANWGCTKGANAYFATGGFAHAYDPNNASTGRLAANVIAFRCLRLDVDCGAGKPYATSKDGLKALVDFCNALSLPLPWIVDSGYGLHVYWAFDQDVPVLQWLQLAQRLAAACIAQKFAIDTTATLDAARVLRMPGTTNYKHGAAKPVRIVAQGTPVAVTLLDQLLPQANMALQSSVPAALRGNGSGNELGANLHTPYMMRGVLQQCPGVAAMLLDGGRRAQEPLWKITLDLVNKSADSSDTREKVARALSNGHPGFDEGSFQRKWAQVQLQDYHPPTCGAMANAGLPECAACPLRGRISSPLVLGRPQPQLAPTDAAVPMQLQQAAAAPPAPPAMTQLSQPSSFQVGVFKVVSGTRVEIVDGPLTSKLAISNGVPTMAIEMPNADGTTRTWLRPLLPYRLVEVERLVDEMGQKSITAFTFDRGLDKQVKVEFSHGEMTDPRTFHSKLQANLLYINRKDASTLLDFFMPEFLAQLQRARAANQIAARCGWTENMLAFVLGTRMYSANGVEHVRPGIAPEEMAAYHEAGVESEWRRAFDLVMSGGADRQAVIALAIASPLMAFTGLNGVLLNAYSPETGVGKSTLGDAALSIWGSPSGLRKNFRDTANATFKIATVTGNLPMVVDEFTNVEGKALSDFVYTVTQGREKHRLTSDAKLSAGGAQRWCLAAITTANNSVHEKLQAYRQDAVAEAARVFELRLHPLQLDLSQLGRLKQDLQAIETNYGFLGTRLAKLYLSKDASFWRELVMRKISKWDAAVARDGSDRFRSATAALIEIGSQLGAALGLGFEVDAISAVIDREWRRQIDEFEIDRKRPADFVNDYILQHMGEFMIIGGANGDALVATGPKRYFGELRGRTVDGKFKPLSVMLPLDLLRNHVREANGNYKAVQEWLRTELANGSVLRMGRLTFLEGQFQQFTTQAVEFSPAILGATALHLVPTPGIVPSAPAVAQ